MAFHYKHDVITAQSGIVQILPPGGFVIHTFSFSFHSNAAGGTGGTYILRDGENIIFNRHTQFSNQLLLDIEVDDGVFLDTSLITPAGSIWDVTTTYTLK